MSSHDLRIITSVHGVLLDCGEIRSVVRSESEFSEFLCRSDISAKIFDRIGEIYDAIAEHKRMVADLIDGSTGVVDNG